MKKIDMILNGTKEQYPSLISKLSNILEPFALLAVGKLQHVVWAFERGDYYFL